MPVMLGGAWITLWGSREQAFRLRSWLPTVPGTGIVQYALLGSFMPRHRPFLWEAVEVDAPGLGVAYGTLDGPLTVPVRHQMMFEAVLEPGDHAWRQECCWDLPPSMQRRGWFLPRRYEAERTIAWKWTSRLGDGGRS